MLAHTCPPRNFKRMSVIICSLLVKCLTVQMKPCHFPIFATTSRKLEDLCQNVKSVTCCSPSVTLDLYLSYTKKQQMFFFQANQKHLKHYECGRFPPKNTFKSFLLHYTEKCTRRAFLGVLFCLLGGLFHRGLNFLSNIWAKNFYLRIFYVRVI